MFKNFLQNFNPSNDELARLLDKQIDSRQDFVYVPLRRQGKAKQIAVTKTGRSHKIQVRVV